MIVAGIPFVHARGDYADNDGRHYGIAIHCTDNTASDSGEASYASRRTDGTSAHFFCDGDSVTQALDTSRKAGHAGSKTGNENAIAVEITGRTGNSRGWWLANVAWDALGRVLAEVIRHDLPGFQVRRASVAEMRSNPTVSAFYSHDDMRQAWGGTDHTDPGPGFPWDRLFSAVNAALGKSTTQEESMLGKVKGDATCWASNGVNRRALTSPSALGKVMAAGYPLIEFATEAELADAFGPVVSTSAPASPAAVDLALIAQRLDTIFDRLVALAAHLGDDVTIGA